MSTERLHTKPMVLRIAESIARYVGFGADDIPQSDVISIEQPSQAQPRPSQPSLRLVPAPALPEQQPGHKWQRHPQLRAYAPPIESRERAGRHDAVRGLYAAREGALELARECFVVAAQCEDVDLTAVPGFWNLTRGQMRTAVEAYDAVGRYREAAALDAHIETIFRPSLVGVSQQPIIPYRPRHRAVST